MRVTFERKQKRLYWGETNENTPKAEERKKLKFLNTDE